MGDKGAREVARAFLDRRALRRGSARTDGTVYYLFGKPIARLGHDSPVQAVKAVLRDEPPPLMLSWAGWPTVSTARHINAVCSVAGRCARARLLQKDKIKTALWRNGEGYEYEANVELWRNVTDI
jgi:hypothetical protein